MNIYIGTSGFAYREWKGKFYPPQISPADMLRFYATRFVTVEINNTFYRMPKPAVLQSWASQVPDNFIFSLKAPQVITHIKQLKNVNSDMEFFLSSVSTLGKRLGPLLFQFPRSFRVDLELLRDFFTLIPDGLSCAFDFRSPTWRQKGITDLLTERGFSFCFEDTDDNPVDAIISTANWGYLRLRRSDYIEEDLSLWIDNINYTKWDKTYVFFKHEDEARGPQLAMRFQELTGQVPAQRRAAS